MAIRRKFNWEEITQKIVDSDKKKSYNNSDEGFFQPKYDDEGNFNAIIRFLPQHVDEDFPFQKVYNHGFKADGGGWFIEDCPTTIGQKCPICTDNSKIYESNQDLAKKRKRKVNFYSNILIVKNPHQPDTEGKVFKFRYGIKIHQKIMEKIAPEHPEIDDVVQVFDYDAGANFKLKIKQVSIAGFQKPVPNYDASSFSEPTPISLNGKALTDEQLEEIEQQIHKLNYLVDPKKFKSFDQLTAIYEDKMGSKLSTSSVAAASSDDEGESEFEKPAKKAAAKKVEESYSSSEDEGESDEDFFSRLRQVEK